ncbi:MAG: acyl-CoA dehydratase activase [Planctomycetota bacterium]|nr:acyl-CoA dehydratase activase [Planctomycetota bacterium]
MKVYCGVDVGAAQTKVALIDEYANVLRLATVKSGVGFEKAALSALKKALRRSGIHKRDIGRTVSCGYGRHNIEFADSTCTEIAAHTKAAFFHFKRALILVDIGGQDNKIVRVTQDGSIETFKMNRKCAAGTGAFLEEIAYRIGVPLSRMNEVAEKSDGEVSLGSFCTVFTATEILSHMRREVPLPHLVKGAFRSVIKRVMEMDRLDGFVVLSGGVVAHNPFIMRMFSESIGRDVAVVPQPEHNGAFGAALFAKEEDDDG